MNHLTSDNYEESIKAKNKPVAVMVTASWCHNCKALAPIFEKTAEELASKADFNYLSVDDNQALAKSLKIMGVPTMLFYRHGVLIAKKVGNQSPNTIKKIIDSLASLTPEEANAKVYRGFFSKLFGRNRH